MVNKFGQVLGWLQYNQLLSALGPYRKILLQKEPGNTQDYKVEKIKNENKISSMIYSALIEQPILITKYHHKWCKILNMAIPFKEYSRAFEDLLQCTLATKYRDFQYRLLLNKIFVNDTLHKWGKVDSKLCDFCLISDDNIVHMLCRCTKVQKIWNNLKHYIINRQFNDVSNLTFTDERIIFNKVHARAAHVINLLVLITKQSIYSCKCTNTPLHVEYFDYQYELIEKIGHNIAKEKNMIRKHCDKWFLEYQEDPLITLVN